MYTTLSSREKGKETNIRNNYNIHELLFSFTQLFQLHELSNKAKKQDIAREEEEKDHTIYYTATTVDLFELSTVSCV